MHKIFELKEMDDEQLLGIAAELGIKGAKKKDKDSLIYEIMDKEAVLDSQKAPEKPAKKRGRPRKNASASYLQRRMKIGYNRAARIIEMMEERGIIGPPNGSKPREILKYE